MIFNSILSFTFERISTQALILIPPMEDVPSRKRSLRYPRLHGHTTGRKSPSKRHQKRHPRSDSGHHRSKPKHGDKIPRLSPFSPISTFHFQENHTFYTCFFTIISLISVLCLSCCISPVPLHQHCLYEENVSVHSEPGVEALEEYMEDP